MKINGTFNHKTFNADHVRLTPSKHTRSLAAEGELLYRKNGGEFSGEKKVRKMDHSQKRDKTEGATGQGRKKAKQEMTGKEN